MHSRTKELAEARNTIAEQNRKIRSLNEQIRRYKDGLPEDSDVVYVNELSGQGIAYKESQLILQIKRVADGLAQLNKQKECQCPK